MRRYAQQHLTLGETFADEAEFVMLEIAQSAMNEFGGSRRGAAGEVILLDQRHR